MTKRKPDPFVAPRDPAQRAELNAKRREAWPHPIGTQVSFKRGPPCVTSTESISFFRHKDGKVAVYVAKSPTSSTRTMVETSRLKVVG